MPRMGRPPITEGQRAVRRTFSFTEESIADLDQIGRACVLAKPNGGGLAKLSESAILRAALRFVRAQIDAKRLRPERLLDED